MHPLFLVCIWLLFLAISNILNNHHGSIQTPDFTMSIITAVYLLVTTSSISSSLRKSRACVRLENLQITTMRPPTANLFSKNQNASLAPLTDEESSCSSSNGTLHLLHPLVIIYSLVCWVSCSFKFCHLAANDCT